MTSSKAKDWIPHIESLEAEFDVKTYFCSKNPDFMGSLAPSCV